VISVLKCINAGHVPTEGDVAAMFACARNSEGPRGKAQRSPRLGTHAAQGAAEDEDRATALAAEIVDRLGPAFARKLIDGPWRLIGECLREQLAQQAASCAGIANDDGDADAIALSASRRLISDVDLVRDPNDASVFRPRVRADASEGDGLDTRLPPAHGDIGGTSARGHSVTPVVRNGRALELGAETVDNR
jgi:hypothetical protein